MTLIKALFVLATAADLFLFGLVLFTFVQEWRTRRFGMTRGDWASFAAAVLFTLGHAALLMFVIARVWTL